MSKIFKIAVFSSGSGTNFEAIVKAKIPNVEVSLLFCNVEGAKVLERAKKLSIDSILLSHKGFESRKDFEKEIIKKINNLNLDLIVLAGFKRILSPFFIQQYEKKVINLHPSLLPAFTGLNAPKQALDYGARFAGCTVHFVDDGIDTGPIILQGVVEVLQNDTEETLLTKIHEKEHEILPKAIRILSENKVQRIDGRRVFIDDDS
ncbi:MAG: phosphoribosylglycinamide formyltransferase [Thermodesulfobacteriota bacterium]|nr:phosphoribosylglycinamide formyltransferase [Thermodesulfobacteriota bacterium]|tara:strand:- start:24964 stop:25578 length:615 start_codon:yes stop_codon:yes gene_type:complete